MPMPCEICTENPPRAGRYIATEPDTGQPVITCALCPAQRGWDSILIRSVPALLAEVRALLAIDALRPTGRLAMHEAALRAIVGRPPPIAVLMASAATMPSVLSVLTYAHNADPARPIEPQVVRATPAPRRRPLATGGPEPVPHSGAVCSTCGDTHLMWLFNGSGDSRKVMCTHCPLPCQSCRQGGNGPYCSATPCACACHAAPAAPVAVGEIPEPAP